MSLGRKHVYLMLAILSLLFCYPQQALSFSDLPAKEILSDLQSGNGNGIFNGFLTLGNQHISFAEGRKFLDGLIEEINVQYKLSLTLSDACRLIKENLHSIYCPSEFQQEVLVIIQQIEIGSPPCLATVSDKSRHLEKVEVFGRSLYWPWEWNWFGLNKKEHREKNPSGVANSQNLEFELPPKMAAGFMCALGGALISIIPGGQGIGLTLIGAGIGLALDGLANGERPYYIDPTNGQIIRSP